MPATQQFYRSAELPWLEIRHSANSASCFDPHTHSTHSIGCLLEGQSYFHYRDQKRTCSTQQLCLINADEVHACRPDTEQGWRYLMLYIEPQWLTGLFNEGAEPGNQPLRFKQPQLTSPSLSQQFIQNCIQLTQLGGLIQQEQLATLLSTLCQQDSRAPDRPQTLHRPALQRTAEYIRAHYQQSLSLTELAHISGLSPSHLQRSFRQHFGVSPAHFQHQCRINDACQRLRQQQPISEVAAATGYADQSHLYRWFRRFIDTTPRQYSKARPLSLKLT